MPKFSPVSYKQLAGVFEADGFRCVRTEGDHIVVTKPGVIRPVVIPKYSAGPVFIIKNNLRTAGISRDRYSNCSVREQPQWLMGRMVPCRNSQTHKRSRFRSLVSGPSASK